MEKHKITVSKTQMQSFLNAILILVSNFQDHYHNLKGEHHYKLEILAAVYKANCKQIPFDGFLATKPKKDYKITLTKGQAYIIWQYFSKELDLNHISQHSLKEGIHKLVI
jgi:hypothetical protein